MFPVERCFPSYLKKNAETVLFSLVPPYRPYRAFLWETKRFFLHQIGTPFPLSLARHTDRRATELSNVCGKEERKRGENGRRRRRRPDVTYPKRCIFGRRRRHGYGWVTGWLFGERREGRKGGGKGGWFSRQAIGVLGGYAFVKTPLWLGGWNPTTGTWSWINAL